MASKSKEPASGSQPDDRAIKRQKRHSDMNKLFGKATASDTGQGGLWDNNDKMHPRNPYKNNPPDFAKLSKKYPDFGEFVKIDDDGRGHVKWWEQEALVQVTRVLLKNDFQLKFEIPKDNLCPPVTQRLNYILWVQDLLRLYPSTSSEQIRGVDIGTGASCIFPLLGLRVCNWNFLATEADPKSVGPAQNNVKINGLEKNIEIRFVENPKHILENVIEEDEEFEFLMCNPPFFVGVEETRKNKKRSSEATESELVTEGGEVEFVAQMIKESIELRNQIRWFTSMLGKKVSVNRLKEDLFYKYDIRPACVKTTEFYQGKQTRWGIGWTFDPKIAQKIAADRRAVTDRVVPNFKMTSDCTTTSKAKDIPAVKKKIENLLYGYGATFKVDSGSAQWSLLGSFTEKKEEDSQDSIGPMLPPQLRAWKPEETDFSFSIVLYTMAAGSYTARFAFKGGKDKGRYMEFIKWFKERFEPPEDDDDDDY